LSAAVRTHRGLLTATTRFALVMALVPIFAATAQGPGPAAKDGFDALKGDWVRPDGGYVISIKAVGADDALDATYFNPNRLPFAKARAMRDGATLRASFELQAGGYYGSTYELVYDPASDRLKGVYYQAVVKQKFDVQFLRKSAKEKP
jgi:uncharacterized protein (DUF2147 family)